MFKAQFLSTSLQQLLFDILQSRFHLSLQHRNTSALYHTVFVMSVNSSFMKSMASIFSKILTWGWHNSQCFMHQTYLLMRVVTCYHIHQVYPHTTFHTAQVKTCSLALENNPHTSSRAANAKHTSILESVCYRSLDSNGWWHGNCALSKLHKEDRTLGTETLKLYNDHVRQRRKRKARKQVERGVGLAPCIRQ